MAQVVVVAQVQDAQGQVQVDQSLPSKRLQNHRALLRSVPPVHILSSCDMVSQMYGIGKGNNRQLELENLSNSYTCIPIDQVIEEASKCVLDCYRTRETNMLAAHV